MDGQREGEEGEETPLHIEVTDFCSNDATNINFECDDDNAVPILVVTRSTAKAEGTLALVTEQKEVVSGPSPCSEPVDSASVEPQQLSVCQRTTGWGLLVPHWRQHCRRIKPSSSSGVQLNAPLQRMTKGLLGPRETVQGGFAHRGE